MLILICQNSIYCLGKPIKLFKGSSNFFVLSGIKFKLLGISPNMFYLNIVCILNALFKQRKRENTIEHTDFL